MLRVLDLACSISHVTEDLMIRILIDLHVLQLREKYKILSARQNKLLSVMAEDARQLSAFPKISRRFPGFNGRKK
jgi:hypothetical protein